jgi:REP element-mobilizing transposase RayT
MASSYNFANSDDVYFVALSTVEWMDTHSRQRYKDITVKSLYHCIDHDGLLVHSWVIMINHLHMIGSRKGESLLSDIMRDFKNILRLK